MKIVLSGREEPEWYRAPEYFIPKESIDSNYLGHFSVQDAKDFLKKLEVNEEFIIEDIISLTQFKEDEIHTLYLALCGDIYLIAKERNDNLKLIFSKIEKSDNYKLNNEKLISRFLGYVTEDIKHAVQVLSSFQTFNEDIYLYLGKKLNFSYSESSLKSICKYSFVWSTDRTDNIKFMI